MMKIKILKALALSLTVVLLLLLVRCVSPFNNLKRVPTPKQKGQNEVHRFVYFADTRGSNNGVNQKILTKTLQQIKLLKPQPEYLLVGGDLVGGSDNLNTYNSQLLNFKRVISGYYSPKIVLPAIGNHEMSGPNAISHETEFAKVFSEFAPSSTLEGYNKSVYYVDSGNVRLIVLNSFHPGEYNQITKSQLDWLKQVSKPEGKIKFIFVHSPAYPTGAHVGSSLDEYPALRDSFWQVIDKNNVMAVFAGHEHNYARTRVDNSFSTKKTAFTRQVFQIIAGTAGAPPYSQYTSKKGIIVPPNPVYHYAVIDVGKESTTVKAYSIDGRVIDEFTIPNVY